MFLEGGSKNLRKEQRDVCSSLFLVKHGSRWVVRYELLHLKIPYFSVIGASIFVLWVEYKNIYNTDSGVLFFSYLTVVGFSHVNFFSCAWLYSAEVEYCFINFRWRILDGECMSRFYFISPTMRRFQLVSALWNVPQRHAVCISIRRSKRDLKNVSTGLFVYVYSPHFVKCWGRSANPH